MEVKEEGEEILHFIPTCTGVCYKTDKEGKYIKGSACNMFDAGTKTCSMDSCPD